MSCNADKERIARSELEALANLIERPPLDDVQLENGVAMRIAAAIRVILTTPKPTDTTSVGEADCTCARRHDPDQIDHERSCAAHPNQIATDVGESDGFRIGARVEKKSGSSWRGRIVGSYSTSLTPVGWAVESETETGSVQIYPEKALRLAPLSSSPASTGGGK